MGIPHRCLRCTARQSFKREWDDYKIKKKCWSCGHDKFYIDRYRCLKENKSPCTCDGYMFPHKKGRGECYHNPNWEEEDDYESMS